MVSNHFEIIPARSAANFASAADLFREYQIELGRDLTFQGFEEELRTLARVYARPTGDLLLLLDLEANEYAGCVAVKPLEDHRCEMKRLFVRPPYRKKKYGRHLVQAILDVATELGYREMWLDTLIELKAAIRLYECMGFIETAPYNDNPFPDVIFMFKEL